MKAGYVTGTGQELVSVHEPWRCWGQKCVIHEPMPGPWESWPTHWREDVRKMERLCPHGVGHPPAEDYESLRARLLPDRFIEAQMSHGCDGCPCAPNPDVIDGQSWETPRALEG